MAKFKTSPEELNALIRAAQTGDKNAMRIACEVNLGLVNKFARRHVSDRMSHEEGVSAGFFGLVRAIELFDESKGFKFSTYAQFKIWSAIAHWKRDVGGYDDRDGNRPFHEILPDSVCVGLHGYDWRDHEPAAIAIRREDETSEHTQIAAIIRELDEMANDPKWAMGVRILRLYFGIERHPKLAGRISYKQISSILKLSKDSVRIKATRAFFRLSFRLGVEPMSFPNGALFTATPRNDLALARA